MKSWTVQPAKARLLPLRAGEDFSASRDAPPFDLLSEVTVHAGSTRAQSVSGRGGQDRNDGS